MKSGFVSVIGKANAGKSTLVNVLVGEKVTIVSPKPQTTRDRITGVLTEKDCQIVFVDTPGIYKADTLLNSVMQRTANDSVEGVDVILFVIDAHQGISDGDIQLLKKYSSLDNLIVVLTKTDIMNENLLISEIKEIGEIAKDIVPVSARKGKNIKALINLIKDKLPEGEKIYEQDIISDRSERFMLAEILREKILLKFDKEIPHGIAVIITGFTLREDKEIVNVSADIICEKESHKAILIGKGGKAIKEFSSFARTDMEKFLNKKVFLTTNVRVKEDWRNSASLLKEYGYGEQ